MTGGLKAGDKVIVAGIQKIGDGAPVHGGAAGAARRHGGAGGGRERVACSATLFIRRPILATVCSLLIILAGAIAIPTLPIARYPDLTPPSVTVAAFYTGANAQAVESAVTTPLEQVDQRRRGHAVHARPRARTRASRSITVTFEIGRDPDLAAVDVQNRVNQALGRMPAEVRTNGISVTKNTAGFLGAIGFYSPDNRYDSLFISQLRRPLRPRRVQARAGRRQRHHLRRAQVRDAAVARPEQAGRPRPHGRRRRRRAARAERAGGRRQRRRRAVVGRSDVSDERARRRPADRGRRVRGRRRQGRARTARSCACSDVGRVELGAESYSSNLRFAGVEASGIGIQLLPTANAIEVFTGVQKELERLRQNFPPGPRGADRVRQRRRRARVDHRGAEDTRRGDRASSCS